MKTGGAILFGLILLLALSNCANDKSKDNNCQTCSTVSFKNDIIPLFAANCALSGCHISASGANHNVALDSANAYTSIMRTGTGIVVAGNPNNSILYMQMVPGGSPIMPPTGQLDACTSHKIYCWILQGALNN